MSTRNHSTFRFKQFELSNHLSAMKVGTDGVLLGSWVNTDGTSRVLDIGTGTGLIALMIAQRQPQAAITAVEIDSEAAAEAQLNVASSPWPGRVKVVEGDAIADGVVDGEFDLIVSNPPYFKAALKAEDESRCKARHESTLSIETLLSAGSRLLAPGGCIALIAPTDRLDDIEYHATLNGLSISRIAHVHTKPTGSCKRVMIELSRPVGVVVAVEKIVIGDEYYKEITSPFYL